MGKWLERLAETFEETSLPASVRELTKLPEGGGGSTRGGSVSFGSARPEGVRELSAPVARVTSPDAREALEERAAILEFDAGMAREVAEVAARCMTSCRHYRRMPPDGEGYCCGRDDLPPVYSEAHPLRRLPADEGATCPTFAPE